MLKTQKTKLAILICMLLMLCIVAGILIYRDYQYCMDVLLIDKNHLDGYSEDPAMDISCLLFNGEAVAFDSERNTIYISQPSDKLIHNSELMGTLASAEPDCSLYFLEDTALRNIPEAVSSSTPLSLAVVKGDSFRTVNVILTTLPVLRLEKSEIHQDEIGQDVMTGSFVLWGGRTSSSTDYTTVSGTTQWHIRGGVSRLMPKKSWKLSLKDANGENKDLDLLGLGADDDWILNAMSMDDTKIRDKLTTELWNQYLYDPDNDYPMSSSQYVEAVINNEYQGLFLLMRRVDAKYLQLDKQTDILLKGTSWTATTTEEAYEIIYSPYPAERTYRILENTLSNTAGSSTSLENFTKTNVFLNYFAALDNAGFKNMFYILRPSETGYTLFYLPWDMDMSMGVIYLSDAGIVYDYSESMNHMVSRIEYVPMKELHPELGQIMADHWKECRTFVYSEPLIKELVAKHVDTICSSGAFGRDVQKWGFLYDGMDTHSALIQYCIERLSVLDSYYPKIIN